MPAMEQTSLNPIDDDAVLAVLAAVFGYVNDTIIKLPHTIGLTIVGARAALAVVAGALSSDLPRRLTTERRGAHARRAIMAGTQIEPPRESGSNALILLPRLGA